MGELRVPPVVTPVVAMLASDADFFQIAKTGLEAMFGPVELESPAYPFDKTVYYTPTMGPSLLRMFFSFKRLGDPAALVEWKLNANKLEADFKHTLAKYPGIQMDTLAERPINLDPGYVTGAKLVLASTKDFAHRIYLREGIFAEITMGFRGDSWVSHHFTFPDFKSGIYDDFFKKVRDWHLRKVRAWNKINYAI